MERVPNRTATTASTLIGECERTWDAIRRYHPDLPEVVFAIGEGWSRGRAGHFAAGRWGSTTNLDEQRAEVFVAGEVVGQGAEAVLEVLLHESAHGLARAREVRDTDVTGRHNRTFRRLAEEVGLVAERDPEHTWRGWCETSLTDLSRKRYADEIERIAVAATHARRPERRRPARNLERYECGCGRVLRMSPSTWAQAPVVCGACGGAFHPSPAPKSAGEKSAGAGRVALEGS